MELSFIPMSRDYASEVVGWRYEAPYDVYGFEPAEQSEGVDYLVDPENHFFAVLRQGELIGFRSTRSSWRGRGSYP